MFEYYPIILMKLKFPNIPRLGGMIVAVRRVNWRDPLVHVWGLLGSLLVVGIVRHYVSADGSGEKKNHEVGAKLFSRRANWDTGWQPAVPFWSDEPVTGPVSPETSEPDLRALAASAAEGKGWRYLSPETRHQIASLPEPVRRISLTWSGTWGGDAAALELYHDNILGTDGPPDDFVIGNGRRSVDGRIEPMRQWRTRGRKDVTGVSICLSGPSPLPTPAQEAALGELIAALEARSGHVSLGTREATISGQLADVD